MADYLTIVGFIQFDPEERKLDSGPTVRDIMVRPAGSTHLVKCTVWPGFADVELERGTGVLLEGKANVNEVQGQDGQKRIYRNLSVSNLAVLSPEENKDERRGVANEQSESKTPF